ncbi:NmrA family NAD(P)-binding protein (plasmid) [Embleya sp. NBC_00888]|uniref:NmrA family NAD(P)-binding protein n=1 Tax=Embleya sp. NBC_00888 TaxID=2975960 RepID=UPI002F919B8B|nr:NmrA family NAD(P)-binding protein [Embleya sp. NBC_00888]
MPETTKRTVLVAGATGKQGGAVADLLRARGHEVVAYVRNPDAPAAATLAADGVRLAVGDLADSAALTTAARGVDAIFGLTVPFGEHGAAEEIAQGRAIGAAAEAVHAHLVHSSVRGAASDDDLKVEHASSKQVIERWFREKELRVTSVQPVYFMENALNVGFNRLPQGVYAFPLSADRRLDQVTVLDIAGLAVHAIENPDTLIGRRIDVVSDSLTTLEVAGILSDVLGKDIPYANIPIPQVRQWAGDEIADMFQSFEDTPLHTDVAALHAEFPEVGWHDFRRWAEQVDWERAFAQTPTWG